MRSEGLVTGALVIAGTACLGTLVGFIGRRWPVELASHFRAQYAWVLVIATGIFIVAGQPAAALLAALCALLNIRCLTPFYRASVRTPQPQTQGTTCRLLLANVLLSNGSYERLRCVIREVDPDLVVLAEVHEEWLRALQELTARYPFSKSVLRPRGFGVLLLSRLPWERADVVRAGRTGLPSIVARLRVGERLLTVIGTHPLSPKSSLRLRLRDRQLLALAELASSQSGSVVLLGDLNVTSWSPVFQDVLRISGLRDSRVGFGLQPTWPVGLPLARIPIDHCLVSPDVIVVRRQRGPAIGSDHYPIIVDLAMRPEESDG